MTILKLKSISNKFDRPTRKILNHYFSIGDLVACKAIIQYQKKESRPTIGLSEVKYRYVGDLIIQL